MPAELKNCINMVSAVFYSPDDGRKMGLEGMIQDVIDQCKIPAVNWRSTPYFKASEKWDTGNPLQETKDIRRIARAITLAEMEESFTDILQNITGAKKTSPSVVLGFTVPAVPENLRLRMK